VATAPLPPNLTPMIETFSFCEISRKYFSDCAGLNLITVECHSRRSKVLYLLYDVLLKTMILKESIINQYHG